MKINVKRRIVINGREYSSLDAMPEELRRVYERAVSAHGDPEGGGGAPAAKTRIVIDGREYGSTEEMPPGIRAIYEGALAAAAAAAEPERAGPEPAARAGVSPGRREPAPEAAPRDYRPIDPGSSKLKWALILIPLLVLIVLLLTLGGSLHLW